MPRTGRHLPDGEPSVWNTTPSCRDKPSPLSSYDHYFNSSSGIVLPARASPRAGDQRVSESIPFVWAPLASIDKYWWLGLHPSACDASAQRNWMQREKSRPEEPGALRQLRPFPLTGLGRSENRTGKSPWRLKFRVGSMIDDCRWEGHLPGLIPRAEVKGGGLLSTKVREDHNLRSQRLVQLNRTPRRADARWRQLRRIVGF